MTLSPTAVAVWAPPPVVVDESEARRTLELVRRPGEVVEIRALNVSTPDYRRSHTRSGYYDDLAKAAKDAANISRAAGGTYFTLNPCDPALLGRAYNRLRVVEQRDPLTSDADIIRRHWMLVDCDPVRPTAISATDAEKEAALERARAIWRHLRAEGWPDPIVGDSGNGSHLLYPCDLPRDDNGAVQRVLNGLAARFDDDAVTVDTSVFNPARISKLYGTRVAKGDHTPDRPHRRARLLHVPDLSTSQESLS